MQNLNQQFNNLNGLEVDRKTLEIMQKRADKEGNLIISSRVAKILHEYNDDRFLVEIVNLVEPFALNGAKHNGLEKTGLDDCGRLQPGYRYAAGGQIVKSAEKAPRKCDTTYPEPTKKPSEATKATANKTALKEKFAAAAQKRVYVKKVVIRQNPSINKTTLLKAKTAVKNLQYKKKIEPKVEYIEVKRNKYRTAAGKRTYGNPNGFPRLKTEPKLAETPFHAEIQTVKKDLKTETDDKKLTIFQNKYKITAKDFIEVVNRESKYLTIVDLYNIATKIDVNEKDIDWNDFYTLLATECYNNKMAFPKTFMLDQGTHFFDESLLINRKPIVLKTKGFDSLANIAGKDNLRPIFKNILCQKDSIVATDAFKIVVLKSDAEKNNAGKLLNINDKNEKYKAIVDGQYPDYSKFMTNSKFDSTVSHYVLELITQVQNYINATKNLGFTASYKMLAIGGKTEFIVNAQYFLDLVLCLYANGSDKVSFFAENKNRIDFETNNGNRAALMCINISGYNNQLKNILLLNKHSHWLVNAAEGLNGASTNQGSNQVGLFGAKTKTIKLSPYTIATNCTDLTDAKDGFNEIWEAEKAYKKIGKAIPKFRKTRAGKLVDRIKVFEENEKSGETGLFGNVKISTDEFKKMSVSELREFTKSYFKTYLQGKKIAINKYVKKVEFVGDVANKLHTPMYSAKAALISKLEILLKNSTYNNWGDRKQKDAKDIVGFLNMKSKVIIDGEKKHVIISIAVTKKFDKRLKSYSVGKKVIKKETDIIDGTLKNLPRDGTITAASKNQSNKINATNQNNGLNFTNPAKRTTLANRMANKSTVFETFEIENKQISAFFGDLERKNKESVVITLTGGQGSGKTRMAFQFMNALAQKYRVGHASIEEHPESKLYFDKVDQYIDSTAINNIENPEIRTMQDLHHLICGNDVIVIDSFAKMREIKKDFEVDADLRKKYNGKLFLVIFQQTVDGKMRGGSTSQFDADVVLFTEAFDDYRDNYVYANKNRYQSKPLDTLQYNIFEQRLANNEEPNSQAENQPVTFSFALN